MTQILTITEAAAALGSGSVTSVQLVESALASCDSHGDELGVFISRFSDSALAAAQMADEERAARHVRSPLHGIPLGIKDIIATEEGPSTAQSTVLDPDWPTGSVDAPVVSRLRAAGGIIVGKTTTFEYAIGFPDPDKKFPIPRNPWNLECTPGGSSSGTAAGIASGMFLGGLGTDTGGSIRMPAAFCGITGLKATFGRVPKSGCVPLGYTLDHIGPMARSARDCALMLDILAGPDASDFYAAAGAPVEPYLPALVTDMTGVRIGVDKLGRIPGDVDPALHPLMDAALGILVDAGAVLVDIEVPLYEELVTAQLVTMSAEAATYHMPDIRSRFSDYGAGARYFIGNGVTYTATDYVQAQRVRRVGQLALAELYNDVDLIVTPTCNQGAFTLDDANPVRPFESLGRIQTQYWNSVGNPVMSVPIGFTSHGLPLGMQIAGRPFGEAAVLNAGACVQDHSDHHLAEARIHTAV